MASEMSSDMLLLPSKSMTARLAACTAGSVLTKYNERDGRSGTRWVKLSGGKLTWGDARSRECKSELELSVASALHYVG